MESDVPKRVTDAASSAAKNLSSKIGPETKQKLTDAAHQVAMGAAGKLSPDSQQRLNTAANAALSTAAAMPSEYTLTQRFRGVVPMARDVLLKRWLGLSPWKLALAVVGYVYAVTPIDILPEAILGPFGLGDDAGIVVLSTTMLLSASGRYLDDRRAHAYSAAADAGAESPATDAPNPTTSPSVGREIELGPAAIVEPDTPADAGGTG